MQVEALQSINEIAAADWNRLVEPGYPFLRHEFFLALEQSGAVSEQTGWRVTHLLVSEQNQTLAILPLFCKTHSMGEYVFDQQWAQAYYYHGLDYYPKLLTAIPFTPSQGQRLLIKPGSDCRAILACLLQYIKELAGQAGYSSWHCLFPDTPQLDLFAAEGLIVRQGVQFHWFNQAYRDFEDFLQTLTASKRKMLRRERRLVAEQGIELVRIAGPAISEEQWRAFFRFYNSTYRKNGAQAYLNQTFFQQIAANMAERIVLILAVKENRYIAAALSFVGADCLYGRYWGCDREYPMLHFETCYYQGLEYCMENNLQRFDSGAQGEHKIARGFEPVPTYSVHWLKDKRFAKSIADFVAREQQAVSLYQDEAASYLPFKTQN
ncbi:MAG: GNAT family N-acetyltransferase [Methylomonas sp.]